MKKFFMLLAAAGLLACTSTDPVVEPATPEVPATPEQNDNDDSTAQGPDLSVDGTIPEYGGETATDAALDRVDAADEDYYENSSFTNRIDVVYDGESVEVTAPEEVVVHRQGAHIVLDMVTHTVKNVEIILAGSSSDGSLKIYSPNKFKLTLNGVDLASKQGPAINNQSKKRTFVHLADGTVNILSDAKSYTDDIYYPEGTTSDDEDRKGCFFSEAQLIFSGTGSLRIEGNQKHALATDGYFRMRPGVTIAITGAEKNALHVKEDVVIEGGLLYANVGGAASKGVKTDANIDIRGGSLRLYTTGDAYYDEGDADTSSSACLKSDGGISISGGDLILKSSGSGGKGINCDGELTVEGGVVYVVTTGGKYIYDAATDLTASPKGIKADGDILINGGTIDVRAAGAGDSTEGIESKSTITFNGGVTTVYAYDDAMNATNAITVNAGHVWCYSAVNDGIDSNGTIEINGGLVIASGSTQPEEGFDCDWNTFKITGGIVIGTGGATSTPTSAVCTQPSVVCNGITAVESSVFNISDSDGNTVVSYILPRTMRSMCVLVSAPAMTQGSQYTVTTGGSVSGAESEWYGYYAGGSHEGGTSAATFTQSSMVTNVGGNSDGRPDGPGGGGGWF